MKREEFEAIFEADETQEDCNFFMDLDDDNAFLGLQIIRKYLPNKGIEGAGNEVIYSVDVDDILDAGITAEDAKKLKRINWMIDEDRDCLACFV